MPDGATADSSDARLGLVLRPSSGARRASRGGAGLSSRRFAQAISSTREAWAPAQSALIRDEPATSFTKLRRIDRIQCPFCGERDLSEFSYRGDAGFKRRMPRRRAARDFRAGVSAGESGGCARRALVSRIRLPQLAPGDARHPHPRDPCGGAGSPLEPRCPLMSAARDRTASQPYRCASRNRRPCATAGFEFDGVDTAGSRAIRWLRLARGGSAAGRPLVQIPPSARHRRGGSEEPNALVELRSGARREANTRATVAELFDGLTARARTRGRPSASIRGGQLAFVADLRRRLLLQDVHVPAALWEKLYEPLIRRAAAWDAPATSRIRTLTTRSRVLRRAGDRRGSGGLSAALAPAFRRKGHPVR